MKKKFVVNIGLVVDEYDGCSIKKQDVASMIRSALGEGLSVTNRSDKSIGEIVKATVRDVDFD